ncbi:MarR family winged helix-turn-helix transcriptional regulator [Geobacillus vulcani]|uniref:MarR family winged helix-turn-helix transcriptional regulator n=1 Tax=Geobacillus vulcani TaxID=135517 RepID=UPI0006913401|nr:MarR family transcriptional regulator [Geobacillus vulcani]
MPNANENEAFNPFFRSVGFLLSMAGRAINKKFENAIQETGLKARHLGVLNYLKHLGPLPQNSIAQKLSIDKSTLVPIIDELERQGLVERKRNLKDRRAYDLTITKSGEKKLIQALSIIPDLENAWFASLNDEERSFLHQILTRLLFGPNGILSEQ